MRRFVLAISLFLPLVAGCAEGVYHYRLRGEVRLLLFWTGRDGVGGGRITVARSADAPAKISRERIEVLFGSDAERIPGAINRWGYGVEISEWSGDALIGTEFRGIMRHSAETSIDEAVAATKAAGAAQEYLYDTTVSKVLSGQATSEFRLFPQNEDFDYRRPELLLSKFHEHLSKTPPARSGQLANSVGAYRAPYGFLTGVKELVRQVTEKDRRQPLIYVYNARPYTLEVLSVRPAPESKLAPQWRAAGLREVAQVRFRSFNTVKRTRTDFELWIPMAGELKGIPLRILLQPRWWLRLQMDLDPAGQGAP